MKHKEVFVEYANKSICGSVQSMWEENIWAQEGWSNRGLEKTT